MIPLDKQKSTKKEEKGDLDPDLELVIRMGLELLTQSKGLEVIKQALGQSKDPAQVIGQFLATMMGKLAEECRDKLQIDPAIFLRGKGFLDAMLNFIEQKLGMPEEFSDQIYGQVLEVVKAGAQEPSGPEEQQAPQAPAGAQGAPAPAPNAMMGGQ